MEIPLKEGWDEMIPKSTVYPQGLKERELIDQTFDQLHQQGRMQWSLHHTPSGYPVFVAYRQVPKADGTMESKGRVVDIRGLNAQTQPDIYPIPTQQELKHGKRTHIHLSYRCSFVLLSMAYEAVSPPSHGSDLS